DCPRAADGARRAVEAGEEPITGGLDLLALEALELTAYAGVVGIEQFMPALVAYLSRSRGRPNNVSEQDGLEHPVDFGFGWGSGQEFLDLVEGVLVVADAAEVEFAGELGQTGATDVLGEVAGVHHGGERVTASMNHQRGCRDGA